MTREQLDEWEKFGIKLALEAGQMMIATSGKNKQIDQKMSPSDLVTETDKAVEQFLFGEIKKKYPGHKTIGEESSTAGQNNWTDEPTWIIDPVDGTMNFVHTFPLTAVSIGVTVNKEPVLGIIYGPFVDKLYTAKRGSGAFCNGKPINVRPCKNLSEALIIAELGGDQSSEKKDAVIKNMTAIMWRCHGIRCLGSCALNTCFIAEGAADGYYEFGIHCWDVAACAVILREAGGTVIDTQGGPLDIMSRRMVAAVSPALAKELSEAITVHLELERD